MVGISAGHDVNAMLQKALMILQHRGQDTAGISVFDGQSINTVKDAGLVTTALPRERIASALGTVGIGHVRYATPAARAPRTPSP